MPTFDPQRRRRSFRVAHATGRPAPSVVVTDAGTPMAEVVAASVVDAAGIASWTWDAATDLLIARPTLLKMTGWLPEDAPKRLAEWVDRLHPADRAAWRAAWHALQVCGTAHIELTLRLARADDGFVATRTVMAVTQRDRSGHPAQVSVLQIDDSEQQRMQALLRHAATVDALTQMPNRAGMLDRVKGLVERRRLDPGFGYAVLTLDFDRFKQVNDSLGQEAGDQLLREVARRLRACLREGDTLMRGGTEASGWTAGRTGGDEFVVVLENIATSEQAEAIAERLLQALALPYTIGNHIVQSSASIGIVLASQAAANDAGTLLRDADIAMHEAKRRGRGRCVVFDPSMQERLSGGAALERELRRAMADSELFVVYQPVLGLNRGGPGGVEALARWSHPTRGAVPPAAFIPIAEESGLIVELGLFVLRRACTDFVSWRVALGDAAPCSLAVNLSPMQLRSATLIEDVRRVLQQTGIEPRMLQMEVTESLAAQDDAARTKLRELKALGVRIALDDFGTGYSSLACLHQLPVDTVKVDRSFVAHAETSEYHRVLIEATIRVAKTLGMETVAEGIETEDQARLMQRLECGHGQGYLFSRPIPNDEAMRWFAARAPGQEAVLRAA